MFSALSNFTIKYRIPIIIIWVVAAVVLFLFSPKLSEVGVTDQSQFLPQNTQSAEASKLLKEKFASSTVPSSTGIIVIYNPDGLSAVNMQEAHAIHDWLVSSAAPNNIENVVSVFENEALASELVSSDNTTMMIIIDFSTGPFSESAKSATVQIRDYLQQNYTNQDIYFTGDTGIFQDLFSSVQETVDRTTLVTVILVAVLLLVIYRSPIAIFLPLIAIGSSFAVSIGIVGFLAGAGAKFSTLAEAYLIVIIFGVGTDYCLFLVSRFREELRQRERIEAQGHCIRHIGPVITASALTVVVAFLSLGISRYSMNTTTGYALAIGVAITLLVGLTLVPAMMSLFGKYLFWPTRIAVSSTKQQTGFGWNTVGKWVSHHPAMVALPIVIVLLLPYIALPGLNTSADVINQLPQNSEAVKGYKVMIKHFAIGELEPLYILIESKQANITDASSLQAIENIAQSLTSVQGVSSVDYFSAPSTQLAGFAVQLHNIADSLGSGAGLDQLVLLQSSGQLLQNLALQYPGIMQSQNFLQAVANLMTINMIAAQIPSTNPSEMPALIAQLQSILYETSDNLNGLVSEFNLAVSTPFSAYLLNTYFSSNKTTARVNVVLSGDPYSSETLAAVSRVRDTVREAVKYSSLAGSSYFVGGESAIQADIMLINNADFGRVFGLSIVGILIVIMILLRSILAPLYMVVTVLLNYGTTLGISTWLFLDIMNQSAMIFILPLFIFVILVALGADYNIFLVSRIREEVQLRPIREAVNHAVAHTGGVITACGIILAGTFATLMTSPLQVVFQVGLAISVGILIDTFLVRALLVPSLATIVGRWSWWPSALFHKMSSEIQKKE
jgi:RND superfamily putative drug exporter